MKELKYVHSNKRKIRSKISQYFKKDNNMEIHMTLTVLKSSAHNERENLNLRQEKTRQTISFSK
jgi:hypothetical protein